jgi:hypothetical protein
MNVARPLGEPTTVPDAAPDECGVTREPAIHRAPPEADRRTLYTIGHSTRSASELIDVLRAFSVTRVVDVRRFPRSRTNPQFGIDVLPETLAGAGLDYVYLPALGGRRTKVELAEEDVNAGWARRPFRNYADYAHTPAVPGRPARAARHSVETDLRHHVRRGRLVALPSAHRHRPRALARHARDPSLHPNQVRAGVDDAVRGRRHPGRRLLSRASTAR